MFIRNWNLWVKEIATGQEKQLTTDGVKIFGYATDNAGWINSDRADRALVAGLPKKFATQQQDQRGVGEMYLVTTPTGGGYSRRGAPDCKAWAYPLPGDSIITTIQRVIIDVTRASHRGSRCRPTSIAALASTSTTSTTGRPEVEPG